MNIIKKYIYLYILEVAAIHNRILSICIHKWFILAQSHSNQVTFRCTHISQSHFFYMEIIERITLHKERLNAFVFLINCFRRYSIVSYRCFSKSILLTISKVLLEITIVFKILFLQGKSNQNKLLTHLHNSSAIDQFMVNYDCFRFKTIFFGIDLGFDLVFSQSSNIYFLKQIKIHSCQRFVRKFQSDGYFS